ncbi:hypothetical protein [Persicirhabdus sediminis]|uniref:hypothetical protein n=1 Tax=Persicirhabdus sediminis TaxID=454144 RepID=UPI001F305875|nr:hypothetical protein [Persicirhabdus sediminis]
MRRFKKVMLGGASGCLYFLQLLFILFLSFMLVMNALHHRGHDMGMNMSQYVVVGY